MSHSTDDKHSVSLDMRPQPVLLGVDGNIVIESQPEITCRADYYVGETITFAWSIKDRSLPSYMREIIEHDDNTASFISALNYNLTRKDNKLNITCSVTIQTKENENDVKYVVYAKRTANLHCKYWRDRLTYVQLFCYIHLVITLTVSFYFFWTWNVFICFVFVFAYGCVCLYSCASACVCACS